MTLSIGLLMFPALMICIFIGFPVAFSLMGVAVFFGYYRFGDALVHQLVAKVDDVASYYVLAAVPLFILWEQCWNEQELLKNYLRRFICGRDVCLVDWQLALFYCVWFLLLRVV